MIRRGGVGTEGLRRSHDSLGSTQQLWDASGCYVTVAKIRLEIIGADAPAAAFEAERIVIGSHESADFVVADATVSRLHCELIPSHDRVVLRDLDSKNGTRVHGIAIKEATLTGTAVLQLGHSKLRVSVEHDTANLPLFEGERLGWLVGQSAVMRRVFAIVEKAAASTESVLIQGEPGTGKAAVAATIHQLSPRADKPLLVLDCSAFPRELLDAELFGCERGAVPGAAAGRPGVFELADAGSLLLDEVGELPIELQPKLLGVLERGSVRRVGGNRSIPVNVRVMATTNRSLGAEVNGHRFRSDLYYRLAGIRVTLPPLRSRFEDLQLLVDDLAARLSLTEDERGWLASTPMMTDLTAHHWSGNVRELRSYIEACLALRTRDVIDAPQAEDARPIDVDTSLPLAEARGACVAAFERGYATRMLRQHNGDVTAAARAAGTDRLTFCRLLLRLGIR